MQLEGPVRIVGTLEMFSSGLRCVRMAGNCNFCIDKDLLSVVAFSYVTSLLCRAMLYFLLLSFFFRCRDEPSLKLYLFDASNRGVELFFFVVAVFRIVWIFTV